MSRLGGVGLLFLFGVAAAAIEGCARNPVTGRPEVVLVSNEREQEIGREEERKVEQSIGLVDDPALVAWVRGIGDRLASHSPRQDVEYRFNVVDMQEPNAFALPGGPVYVSRGLLALINDESELACVIGHEIGHVAARHSVRRLSVGAPFAVVFGVPSLIVGTVSETLGGLVGGVGRTLSRGLVLAPYDREQEREADRIGVELAAKGGWDPTAMQRFLATLEREVELMRGQPRRPGFFDSHPSTPERARDTARYAAKLASVASEAPGAGDRAALLGHLDGLWIGPHPSQGVFDEGVFLHPLLGFAVEFPEGWHTENAPELVAAVDPADSDTYSLLQLATEGADPLDGARADGIDADRIDAAKALAISGLPAARLAAKKGGYAAELTWIAYRGQVYRVAGVAPVKRFDAQRDTLRGVSESFRPLTDEDRERIRGDRLRAREARTGESLAELIERTGSSWTPEAAAVANGLDVEARLAAGQRLKLAIPEVYRSR